MTKEKKPDIIFETSESDLIWNAKWRLIRSQKDDGVQFVQWEYRGVPTDNIWKSATAVPESLMYAIGKQQ